MRFKFLKDVEVYGVVHKSGETFETNSYDEISPGEVRWCIGHGCRFPLKIGTEIEAITPE